MKAGRRAPGAGVRKPPGEETAGGVVWPRVRRYGDFNVRGVFGELSWGPVRQGILAATRRVGCLRGGGGVAQRRSNDMATIDDAAVTSMFIVGREPAQQKCGTGCRIASKLITMCRS
jgi:hypothetical protein